MDAVSSADIGVGWGAEWSRETEMNVANSARLAASAALIGVAAFAQALPPLTADQVHAFGIGLARQYKSLVEVKKSKTPFTELAVYARTRPEVNRTTVVPSEYAKQVALELRNGMDFVFSDSFRASPRPGRMPVRPPVDFGVSPPWGPKVRLVAASGSDFWSWQDYGLAEITQQFKKSGLTDVVAGALRLETFPSLVQGAAYLVVHTHAGVNRNGILCLETDSILTSANLATWMARKDEVSFNQHYDPAQLLPGAAKPVKLGMKPEFIRRNVMLQANAWVCLYACFGGTSIAGDLRSAFYGAGADMVLGWNGEASSDGVRNLISYLDLGLGQWSAHSRFAKQNPPQRPFPLADVWKTMQDKGVHVDGGNGSQLRPWPSPDNGVPVGLGILRPSIMNARLRGRPGEDEVELYGTFGVKKGQVTVDDVPLTVVEWAPTGHFIRTRLPDTGAASTGTLRVVVDRIKSNPRQVVWWQGRVDGYFKGLGSCHANVRVNLTMRGILQDGREKPLVAPSKLNAQGWVVIDKISTGSWSASGSWQTPDGKSWETWSGSGTLTAVATAGGPGSNLLTLGDGVKPEAYFAPETVGRWFFGVVMTYPRLVVRTEKGTKPYPKNLSLPLLNGPMVPIADALWNIPSGGISKPDFIVSYTAFPATNAPARDEPR